jgi:hypothetical protein
MAKRFLTHVDLTGNQLINSAFEKLTSDPNSGNFEGRIYYNTASALLKVFDGAQWIAVGAITNILGTTNEVDVSILDGVATISLPATINANTTGNASTATTLANSRTISLGGDLSGSASFNGGSDITINATVQPDSVVLGTDTTGNYVASVSGSGAGINVSGSGEGATVTVTNTGVTSLSGTANEIEVSASTGSVSIGLPDDVIIGRDLTVTRNTVVNGDLTVNGTTTYINTQDLNVKDNIVTLNYGLAASVVPTLNAGIEVARGSESTVGLRWNESLDTWQATRDGSIYKDIVLAGDIVSASAITGFDEAAQDAVGTILVDTSTIDFSYSDGTPSITADVNTQATNSYLVSSSGLAVDIASLETKLVNDSFTKKVSANVGNAAGTSFSISHNLGTRDVVVNVYDNATYDTVECDVVRTDINTVTVSFSVAPATNAYRVVIIG